MQIYICDRICFSCAEEDNRVDENINGIFEYSEL